MKNRLGTWFENVSPRETFTLEFRLEEPTWDPSEWVLSMNDGPWVVAHIRHVSGKTTIVYVDVLNESNDYHDAIALLTRSGSWGETRDRCATCHAREIEARYRGLALAKFRRAIRRMEKNR